MDTKPFTCALLGMLLLAGCDRDPLRPEVAADAPSGPSHTMLIEVGFFDLGTLGGTFSIAEGISDSGVIVGHSETGSRSTHAFLWAGEMYDLGGPSITRAYATNGSVTVGESSGRAVRWIGSAKQELGGLEPGTSGGGAYGVNGSGDIVGFGCVTRGPYTCVSHAFLWTEGEGMRDLTPTHIIDYSSKAYDINDSQQVVGVHLGPTWGLGFIWSRAEGLRSLPPLPGHSRSEARAINNLGDVVGISWGPDTRAVLWPQGGPPQDLGTLVGNTRNSQAWDINDQRQVVGSSQTSYDGNNSHAFVWTEEFGMEELLRSPSVAYAINERGQIAGSYLTAQLRTHAALWEIACAPYIHDPRFPADTAVAVGEPFSLSVDARGKPIPTYQWYKDGEEIEGATETTYAVAAATLADAGTYYVRVRNSRGTVVSRSAEVVVLGGSVSVTVSDLSHIYDGSPKAATVATDPPGLAVALTYDGSPVPPTDAGSYEVIATVVGPGKTGGATGTLIIAPATQEITFTSLPPNPARPGDSYLVSATGGGSGNPVLLSALTPSICSVAGSTVSFDVPGSCTIAANQSGSQNYLAAPEATQTVDVRELSPGEQIEELRDLVASLSLDPGLQNSLLSKLEAASQALARGNRIAACNQLRALINQVNAQSSKKLAAADAAAMIASATRIREAIGC